LFLINTINPNISTQAKYTVEDINMSMQCLFFFLSTQKAKKAIASWFKFFNCLAVAFIAF
jgi:hypothetical protein